jgi:hypothetical protein
MAKEVLNGKGEGGRGFKLLAKIRNLRETKCKKAK